MTFFTVSIVLLIIVKSVITNTLLSIRIKLSIIYKITSKTRTKILTCLARIFTFLAFLFGRKAKILIFANTERVS